MGRVSKSKSLASFNRGAFLKEKQEKLDELMGVDLLPKFMEDPKLLSKILLNGISTLMNQGDIDYVLANYFFDAEKNTHAQILAHLVKLENEKYSAFRLKSIIESQQAPAAESEKIILKRTSKK